MIPRVDTDIADWQASGHEIGLLVFGPTETASAEFPYYPLPEGAQFLGLMEADAICLMPDGAIDVYDHEVAGRLFCHAAPNQSVFVEALGVLEAHFEKCAADETLWEDESVAVQVRERCTEILGGDQYEGFLVGLLGV